MPEKDSEDSFYYLNAYQDDITPGQKMTILHNISFNDWRAGPHIAPLVTLTREEVTQRKEASITLEKELYAQLKKLAAAWDEQAAQTMLLERALEYLQTQIQQDGDAAFVVQSSASEVRLGGNALAILAMTEYATAFDSDAYDELIAQLAQGILRMQNDDGRFTHVLNAEDYSVKEQSRGTLYDGEATFALARAYGRTKQKNFLEGAKRAADWMGEQKYEQYGDHWVAYAMNELTKYAPEQRYFLLGIQNAQQHLEEIEQRETTSPTGLELLMATFELVGRAQTEHISINGVSGFGTKTLARAIQTRVNVMLDGYFYPELAMYMQRPQRVEGTFFVRQDAFRVRIDDVQHNMNAFYAYAQNYDAVQKAAK